MKQQVLTIFVLLSTILTSCGGNSTTSTSDAEFTVTGDNGKTYTSYQAACRNQDFNAAHDFLDYLCSIYIEAIGGASTYGTHLAGEKYFTPKNNYFNALEYIYKQEIMYLISENGDEAASRVAFLLNEFQPVGTKPQAGIVDFHEVSDNSNLDAYSSSVQHFNQICDMILDIAISQRCSNVAHNILTLYKDDVYSMTGGSSIQTKDGWFDKAEDGTLVDGNHAYVKFVSTSRDAAKKKYDDAVKSGAFNE